MRSAVTSLVFAVVLASLVASCVGGIIERGGSRHGVRVGMTFDEANAALERRGMQRFPGPPLPDSGGGIGCAGRPRQSGETVMHYGRNMRPPVTCIYLRSNRVAAIAWEAY